MTAENANADSLSISYSKSTLKATKTNYKPMHEQYPLKHEAVISPVLLVKLISVCYLIKRQRA